MFAGAFITEGQSFYVEGHGEWLLLSNAKYGISFKQGSKLINTHVTSQETALDKFCAVLKVSLEKVTIASEPEDRQPITKITKRQKMVSGPDATLVLLALVRTDTPMRSYLEKGKTAFAEEYRDNDNNLFEYVNNAKNPVLYLIEKETVARKPKKLKKDNLDKVKKGDIVQHTWGFPGPDFTEGKVINVHTDGSFDADMGAGPFGGIHQNVYLSHRSIRGIGWYKSTRNKRANIR